MTVRRLASLLSVCLVATASLVGAQPAPDPAPPPPPAGTEGSAVEMTEDPPPDMEGTNEDPDAPRPVGTEVEAEVTAVPEKKPRAGYPMEEVLRPITVPRNMSEVAIGPRAQLGLGDGPYIGSDTLRARYGITRQVQLGLQYALGGVYDAANTAESKIGFHAGKALGLDVTVLLEDWVGVRLGVPVWIDRPVAVGVNLGAPMKFVLTEKLAIGGLDDVLAFRINRFAPTFEHEAMNEAFAAADDVNTKLPAGYFRIPVFVVYQQDPKLAFIGRFAITLQDFTATGTQSMAGGGATSSLRGGFQYTVRKYLDLGLSIGWDDLSQMSTFGPAGLLAFRI